MEALKRANRYEEAALVPINPQQSSGPKIEDLRRRELGSAFATGGELYERVRPGYPDGPARWLLPAGAKQVVDLGAGTGKFTERLVDIGLEVTAVDPSASMLRQLNQRFPEVRTVLGSAEESTLAPASADAVLVAQAWHWFDPVAASAEIARVLRPGGTLGIIWNQLDVRVPWVHRLARIMHAGDVHQSDHQPVIGKEFGQARSHLSHRNQSLSPAELIELVKSRSYYLRANETSRAKVIQNMNWYLFEHLGHRAEDQLDLPYLTIAWQAEKS